ncbi:MAG: hypothetical protein EBT97_10085 [Actinobacteria bacterium]|nr:hypothetical protein [Actinomycetota bacterium]
MSDLRSRLAHADPELRPHVLPLVASTGHTAGWTQGVFDRAEIEGVLSPVSDAVRGARARLQAMLGENEQMSRTYAMAGMEYREEQKAARETRAMLVEALRKLDTVKVARTAAWENLPEGWTDESVQSFWDSLTGDVKHKITKCMKQMEGHVTDTGAFCGGLASQVGYRAASGPRDATSMRRAAIRVAHEDPSVRAGILARLPR